MRNAERVPIRFAKFDREQETFLIRIEVVADDNRLDLDLALEVAASFHLDVSRAKEMMEAVRHAVKQWRHVATRQKL